SGSPCRAARGRTPELSRLRAVRAEDEDTRVDEAVVAVPVHAGPAAVCYHAAIGRPGRLGPGGHVPGAGAVRIHHDDRWQSARAKVFAGNPFHSESGAVRRPGRMASSADAPAGSRT